MLKIGISAAFSYPDPNRAAFGPKTLMYLEKDLANYICQEAILPVLIPLLADDSKQTAILAACDGFILQGGVDVAPSSYGEEGILNERWKGDKYRDAYELKIVDFALKNNKPVLGICRGCQLMNVYFGGTLYQDIPTERPDACLHRDATLYDQIAHEVQVNKGGSLSKIYPDSPNLLVNSIHHQAIKKLGNHLRIEAFCTKDEVVEAIAYTGQHPFLLGVQWHPEFSYNSQHSLAAGSPIIQYFLQKVALAKEAKI